MGWLLLPIDGFLVYFLLFLKINEKGLLLSTLAIKSLPLVPCDFLLNDIYEI
jgi:hypothetical protein